MKHDSIDWKRQEMDMLKKRIEHLEKLHQHWNGRISHIDEKGNPMDNENKLAFFNEVIERIESLEHWREEHDPIYKDDPQREIRETPKKHETHHGLEIEDLVPVREHKTPIATLGVGHKTTLQEAKQHPCYKCKYAKPGQTNRWQDTDCTRRRMCHKWHVWAVGYFKGLEFFCPICGQRAHEKNGYFICSMPRCGWSEE